MAKRNRQILGRLAIALAIAVVALPFPAGAQFFGSTKLLRPAAPEPPAAAARLLLVPAFRQSRRRHGGGGGGGGDQYNPFYRPTPPPVESYKPPPPRKLDTPPTTTVMVIGDTMADWLAYGLEEVLSDTPDVGVVRNIRPTSGLVRYDAKNDALEWAGVVKDALVNDKPGAIVVMLGLNDRLPFRDKVPPKSAPQAAPAAQPQAQDKTRATRCRQARRRAAAGRRQRAAAPRPARQLRLSHR